MNSFRFDHGPAAFIGAYYFFKGDLETARKELPILVQSGVNHLWLFVDNYFRKDQPGPVDEFEAFLEILAGNGLKFIPVIGQFISIEEHPEVRIVVGDGTLSSDPRYWNMGCFRHPVNLEWACHEITQFLRTYKEHPQLCWMDGRIPMSFVHETYYRTDTPEMGGENMRPNCYCEFCSDSFRKYIMAQYTSLSEFNRTHTSQINNWEDLPFPAGPEPDPPLWLDWVADHFRAIPDFLRQLIAAARKEAPIFSTHECNDFYPGSWQTVLTGNHLWHMGAEIDFGHEDMYPLEFDQQYQIYIYGLMKDLMRSAMGFDKPITANGQAFQPWVIPGKLPENSMIEQAYTSLIHGISGLVWWLGDDLELWRKMKEPNEILARWLPQIPELKPQRPEIALFYSYSTLAMDQNDWHTLDLELIYTALCQLGIPVDVISESQIMQAILDRHKYKMILMPGVSVLASEVREVLLGYAKNGGIILADCPWKSYHQYEPVILWQSHITSHPRYYKTTNHLIPGGQELFIPVESPVAGVPSFALGAEMEIVAAFDGGQPALVVWKYGDGKVMGLGSMLGVDFGNFPGHIHLGKMFPFLIRMNRDARNLLKLLCRIAGIIPLAAADNPGVEVGVFDRGESRVCMAVNHLPEAVSTIIRISGGTKLLQTGMDGISAGNDAGDLTVTVQLGPLMGEWFEFA